MARPTKKNLAAQAALTDWLADRDGRKIALTLTFKPSLGRMQLSREIASKTIKHYLAKLNAEVFGHARRYRKHLKVLVVVEGGEGCYDKHVHHHIEITLPDGWSARDFTEMCLRTWRGLAWASRTQNVIVESDGRWLDYMLKLRDKPDYIDAFDWQNTQLH